MCESLQQRRNLKLRFIFWPKQKKLALLKHAKQYYKVLLVSSTNVFFSYQSVVLFAFSPLPLSEAALDETLMKARSFQYVQKNRVCIFSKKNQKALPVQLLFPSNIYC